MEGNIHQPLALEPGMLLKSKGQGRPPSMLDLEFPLNVLFKVNAVEEKAVRLQYVVGATRKELEYTFLFPKDAIHSGAFEIVKS